MQLLKKLFENDSYIVCVKPAGIPVQTRSVTQQDCESILRNALGLSYVGIVHRLDQPVEGILVFAKTPEECARLNRIPMEKQYLARISGSLCPPSGILRNTLLKDGRTNTSKVVPDGTAGGKIAELAYEMVEEDLVRIRLKTGRHHQIRVQLSNAGCPIVGDVKYGGIPAERLHLCACRLEFDGRTFETIPTWLNSCYDYALNSCYNKLVMHRQT